MFLENELKKSFKGYFGPVVKCPIFYDLLTLLSATMLFLLSKSNYNTILIKKFNLNGCLTAPVNKSHVTNSGSAFAQVKETFFCCFVVMSITCIYMEKCENGLIAPYFIVYNHTDRGPSPGILGSWPIHRAEDLRGTLASAGTLYPVKAEVEA